MCVFSPNVIRRIKRASFESEIHCELLRSRIIYELFQNAFFDFVRVLFSFSHLRCFLFGLIACSYIESAMDVANIQRKLGTKSKFLSTRIELLWLLKTKMLSFCYYKKVFLFPKRNKLEKENNKRMTISISVELTTK